MQVAVLAFHCSLLAAEEIKLEIQKFKQIDSCFSMTFLAFFQGEPCAVSGAQADPSLAWATDKERNSFMGVVYPSLPAYFFDFVQGFNVTSTLREETDEIRKGFLRMNNSTGIT